MAHRRVSAVSFPSCEGTLPVRLLTERFLREERQNILIGGETNRWGSKSNTRAPADRLPPSAPSRPLVCPRL